MSKIKGTHLCIDFEDHKKYLSRIKKTLYYGKLPKTDSLSIPITELTVEVFSEAQRGKSLNRLHYNDAANISYNTCISPCSLILAMLYIDKLKTCNPVYLERTAPSDLFLVSLMVSSKFLFDDGECDEVFMKEWATSAGIDVKKLGQLEKDFLKAIEWEIFVNKHTFWKKLNDVEMVLAKSQGLTRGFFTYTELEKLSPTVGIQNIIHCLIAVSMVLVATYTVGLLTLLGSIHLTSNIPGTSLYTKKIAYEDSMPMKCNQVVEINMDMIDYETENKEIAPRTIDAADMLKTGILLASLTSNSFEDTVNYTCQDDGENYQSITWDWWSVPVMNWLSKISELKSSFDSTSFCYFPYLYFIESAMAKEKYIDLEAKVQKATKTRIQDQIESSWHKEWIDTINYSS